MFSFVKNRPPLVVFFLCIVTLTITVFCFAFYIKNTDPIPDSDRIYDWTQLLRHFNDLDVCVDLNLTTNGKTDNDSFIEMSKVQTLISVNNSDWLKKITSVKGSLTLENWRTKCPKNYSKPNNLHIYFDIPKLPNADVSKFDVCVTIEGPTEYLPIFSEPNCNIPVEKKTKKVGLLTTSVRTNHGNTFCKEAVLTNIHFYPPKKDNFASFLSENEKSIIYLHLLWTSYILVFLLLIIVVYGTLQSDHIYDKYLHKWVPFHNQ